jgi:hypothetical protein
MTTNEREDLDNLLKSPGWQRLEAWARHEWQEQMIRHTEVAADATNDIEALNKLRQVIAAKKAVEVVLSWPSHQLKRITTQAAGETRVPALARGGF